MKTHRSREQLRKHILLSTRMHFGQGMVPSLAEIARAADISRATFYRAFSSREELLQVLHVEPERESRERLLEKALEMIGRGGLVTLSMDALADAAGVSRATVYRLFPGKALLFREVVKTYAPFEHLAQLVERVADQPPEVVMPQVGHVLAELFWTRLGFFRTLAFEMSKPQEDTEEAIPFIMGSGIEALLTYLQQQMQAGQLRPMVPFVALQAFWGPLVLHLLTRPLVERELGSRLSLDEVITQFVALWLRAMEPEQLV